MAYQSCNKCGKPVRMCGGALCAGCTRDAIQKRLEDRTLAAERTEILLNLLKPEHAQQARMNIPVPTQTKVIATAAVEQLAKAWGVQKQKNRKENKCR